jgi:hypothetical protein
VAVVVTACVPRNTIHPVQYVVQRPLAPSETSPRACALQRLFIWSY